MILLDLQCDNFFMFRKINIDFTYARKVNYDIARDDTLFEGSRIRVRKNIIIMGANSSGKTTLGRLLCLIYNYLICRDNGTGEALKKAIYDHKKNASFCIDFYINQTAYRLKAEFDSEGLIKEKLSSVQVKKSYTISDLQEKLNQDKHTINTYDRNTQADNDVFPGFQSYVLRVKKESHLVEGWKHDIRFWFALSKFHNDPIGSNGLLHVNVSMISKILPVLDHSVEKVIPLAPVSEYMKVSESGGTEEYKPNNSGRTYTIRFKNQDELTIPDGDLNRMGEERLSQGTIETIAFSSILSFIRDEGDSMVYVDECLAHMHSELEKYVIWLAFHMKSRDSQLVFTTHNAEVCDLDIPSHSFLFLQRTEDGFSETMWANSKLNKNDRNFRNYYENDFFGILPDYGDLITIFGKDGD